MSTKNVFHTVRRVGLMCRPSSMMSLSSLRLSVSPSATTTTTGAVLYSTSALIKFVHPVCSSSSVCYITDRTPPTPQLFAFPQKNVNHHHQFCSKRTFASTGKPMDHTSVKTITFRTCVGTYDRLRKVNRKLYKKAPSDGIDITIDYYDNLNPATEPEKTIVAIHGVPGNYTHFDPIPQYFAKKNVRVIVPNLPDFADTRRTKAFWHSTEEKCQFLKDFLSQLNVKKIDCLISHSFGIQTISQFWDQCGDIEINSYAFFAPQPLWKFEKQKESSNAELIFLFKTEWWYNFLDYLKIHKRDLIPMRLENINEFLLMATIGFQQRSSVDLPGRIDKLVKSDKPVILLFGSRERLISKRSIKALHERLGVSEDEIVHIDKEKDTPEKSIRMDKRIMYYNLKDGGHFAHANFHPYTIKMIENLLEYQPESDQEF